MILSILLKRNHLLLAIHKGDRGSPEFYRYDVTWRESGVDISQGHIWDQTGETAERFYLDAGRIVVVLPASVCMARRMELDNQLNDRIPDYRKWRAGIQLPGDPDLYSYGFIQLMKSYDGKKTETIFFASPAVWVRRLARALFRADDTREVELVPEHVGLTKVIDKSIGSSDIPQATIAHCDNDGVVVVFVKDGRFYNGRYFPIGPQTREGLSIDIETYLLSLSDPDESLPLVITGSAEDFKTAWSPIIPAFLNVQDLDFSSAWGSAEFVFAGGKCELSAAF